MKRFEFVDHTADIGIIAYGIDLGEAFANCAYAMFTLIAEMDEVQETTYRDIQVEAYDKESLLVTWLNELLYVVDVERLILKRFEFLKIDETHLAARCYGEEIDLIRHTLQSGVKAATYHMLEIGCDDICTIFVILDV